MRSEFFQPLFKIRMQSTLIIIPPSLFMKENLASKTGHFHFAKSGHYHVAGTERGLNR
jgi:hypothetical protein